MASRGKMLVKLALKKAKQQQDDQTVAVKADKRAQKDNIHGLDMSIIVPVSVTVTEIISSVLGSTADELKLAEAAVADLRADMPATTYEQDSEIDINERSFDSDIDETPARPIADQNSKSYCNDYIVLL